MVRRTINNMQFICLIAMILPSIMQAQQPTRSFNCEHLDSGFKISVDSQNAQYELVMAINCPKTELHTRIVSMRRAQFIIRAANAMDVDANPLFHALLSTEFYFQKEFAYPQAEAAWGSSIKVLEAVETPLNLRERIYVISALGTLDAVLHFTQSPTSDLNKNHVNRLRVQVNTELGYDFIQNTINEAVCFIRSDIGDSIDEIIESDLFTKCIEGMTDG